MNHLAFRKKITGFSLVSLMISMVLGIFVVGAITILISETNKNYRFASALAELHENGRYAVHVLSTRLRMAGSLTGCTSDITFKNVLSFTPFTYDITKPVEGFESIGTGAWSPSLTNTGLTAGTNIGNFILPKTDLLLVRRKTGAAIPLVATMASPTADLLITANITPAPFTAGNIVTVSDYEKCSLFQITAYDGSAGQVSHQIGLEIPGNALNVLADIGAVYDNTATISRLLTEIFYIGTGTDGEPTLYLKSGSAAGIEMIGGIEDLQLLYGEDLDGDVSADRYLPANSGIDMANLVSVRVHLLVRSKDEVNHLNTLYRFMGNEITAEDRRLRREFITIIQLRNTG